MSNICLMNGSLISTTTFDNRSRLTGRTSINSSVRRAAAKRDDQTTIKSLADRLAVLASRHWRHSIRRYPGVPVGRPHFPKAGETVELNTWV